MNAICNRVTYDADGRIVALSNQPSYVPKHAPEGTTCVEVDDATYLELMAGHSEQAHYIKEGKPVESPQRPAKDHSFNFKTKQWDAPVYTYGQLRKAEYPPLTDLADAIYWQERGDPSKMVQYLRTVENVKQKHPKPVS